MSLRLPWRAVGVAAAALLVAAAPGLSLALRFDRAALLGGEAWRLLSGHLVHGGPEHLLWNLLPLLGLGMLFEEALGRRFWGVLGLSALTVSGGLLLLQPQLGAYVGLSGALNGLWVAGALTAARGEEREGGRWMAAIYRACVLLDLAKIALEAATGTPLFTDPATLGGPPVPLAHALGALGGVLALRRPRRDGGMVSLHSAPADALGSWELCGPAP